MAFGTVLKAAKRKKVSQQFAPTDGGDVPALDVPGNKSSGIPSAAISILKKKKRIGLSLLGG